ncbi:MAG: RNA chaperone Hfq [Armatimonadota bacterium]
MNKGQSNLQDLFLNQIRKDRTAVTIYLIGGVQLKGLIKGFDPFTVLLDSPGKPVQMVYKHAIASVVPSKDVNIPLQQEFENQTSTEMSAE